MKIQNPQDIWIETSEHTSKRENGRFRIETAKLKRGDRESEGVALVSDQGTSAMVTDGISGCQNGSLFAIAAAHAGVEAMDSGSTAREAIAIASKISRNIECYVTRQHGGAAGAAIKIADDGTIEWSCRGDVALWKMGAHGLSQVSAPHCLGDDLTNYLGKRRRPDSHGTVKMESPADVLLVASGGVWKYVDAEALADCFLTAPEDSEEGGCGAGSRGGCGKDGGRGREGGRSKDGGIASGGAARVVAHAAQHMTPGDATLLTVSIV